MNMLSLLDKAIIFAVQAHSGMVRKGTDTPFVVHPIEAAAIVATMTNDVEIIAAAVLHDTVEDTLTSIEDIQCEFGDRVATIVTAESENKREDRLPGDTWLERKKETIDHLTHSTDEAEKMAALADKLSNIRAMYRDSKKLGEDLWKRFNQKDKQMHAWYYRSIGSALSELDKYDAYAEYMELTEKVFGNKSFT